MSYKLNKTDGSLLVDLVDGSLDTTSTDISLIGKNYSGFGEVILSISSSALFLNSLAFIFKAKILF